MTLLSVPWGPTFENAESDAGLSGIGLPMGVRDAGVSATFIDVVTLEPCLGLFIIAVTSFCRCAA